MKKHVIRAITLCLVLFMTLPMLFACSTDKTGDGANSSGSPDDIVIDTSNETDENGEINERAKYMPERIDYDGVDFKIVQDLQSKKQYIAPVEGAAMAADAVNIAFVERNKLLETYYNIKVKIIDIKTDYGVKDELEIAAGTNDDFADIIFSIAGSIMHASIPNGYVIDLNTLEPLNLEASYYDQRIQEEYLIEGKLFCIEGDFSVYDELRTHVVGINKSIYKTLQYDETYGSPYDLVRDRKWTLDLMLKMAKDTSDYATLGTGMTKDSQWGIISESPFPYIVYLGTGRKIIEVNDGSLVCTLANDERTSELFVDCVDKIFKNPEILIADKSAGVLSSDKYWSEVQSMFSNGQALFRTSTLSDFTQYRDMKDEFGILPVPLYAEGQPEYYSWCSGQAHAPLLVPRTVEGHEDRTATIIEGMAYFSKYMIGSKVSLLDAFYKKMTHAKLCRSAEDYEMLELIFANKTFDIIYVLNLEGANLPYYLSQIAGTTDYSVPGKMAKMKETLTSTDPQINPLDKFLNNMWKHYQ